MPKKANDTRQDDLTQIRGIGKATALWLRREFKVKSFAALAALDPETVDQRRRESGIPVRSETQDWISQARQLAAAGSIQEGQSDHRGPGSPDPKGHPPTWDTVATFVVAFEVQQGADAEPQRRITVQHHEGEGETQYLIDRDLRCEEMCRWMLQRVAPTGSRWASAGSRPQAQAEVAAADLAAETAGLGPPALRVIELRASQPPGSAAFGTARSGQPLQGSVASDKPFGLEAYVELLGPAASAAANAPTEVIARFYSLNLETFERKDLGVSESSKTKPGRTSMVARLPETTLPSGLYRITVVTSLPNAPVAPGYLEVPLLHVV